MVNANFWRNKKVFITGHTGFKGSWLCLWLHSMGAKVTGYSLKPPTNPNLYELCSLVEMIPSYEADIRDKETLTQAILVTSPDIVIHMAAQPIVRTSYKNPVETFETNIMGTVHVLEAARAAATEGRPIQAVLNVTTDKCYQNHEWPWGYREIDRLGGHDPYSTSKACSELITDSYRNAYFTPEKYDIHRVAIASARAGNVIGGGDWAADRLIPDCIRSIFKGEKIKIRFPKSRRPWQHVLEPLHGYLMLLEKLFEEGPEFAEAWNFGPNDNDIRPVEWVVQQLCEKWGEQSAYEIERDNQLNPAEACLLKLDCSKAKQRLGWFPVWDLNTAINKIVEWNRAIEQKHDPMEICMSQIKDYIEGVNKYGN
jgi:CDP-glucose 4,6-dehydratase